MDPAALTFQNLIGQPKAKTFFNRALARDSLAHAYLFRGPSGVGKKRAARTLAALSNCLAPVAGDACTTCAACVKYAASSHPDLLEIEPEKGTIRIDQVRKLQKALQFAPFEANYRFVILPDIHNTMRRKETANSLLKTLEEPPAHTILILTADETGGVLPTILSRCQVIPFFALPYDEVAHRLATTDGIDQQEAAALARIAEGSLGRARFLHESNLLAERSAIAKTLCHIKPNQRGAAASVLALADQAAARKHDLPELLALLSVWFRDLILHKMGAAADSLANPDLVDLLPTAAEHWSLDELHKKMDLLRKANKQLAHNCRPSLVCEVLFFALL